MSDVGFYRGPVGPDGKMLASWLVIFPVFLLMVLHLEIIVLSVVWLLRGGS